MRMFSKHTILLLILILFVSLLPTVPISAAEENSDVTEADEKYIEACDFLNMLAPELDLKPGENKNVPRAAFVKNLVTLVNPGLSGTFDSQAKSVFLDVPENNEFASYIEIAAQTGIINTEASNFFPEQPITLQQAYKMAVCAIGYGMYAEETGGYPVGYLSVAFSAGLNKQIIGNPAAEMSERDAAILLYNTILTEWGDIAVTETANAYKKSTRKSILSEQYHMIKVSGIVEADENSSLLNLEGAMDNGKIMINNIVYLLEQKENLLGLNVTAYYKEKNGENVITYIKPYKNTIQEVLCDDVNDFDGERIIAYKDGIEIKYKLIKDFLYIYNGKAKILYGEDKIKYFNMPGGRISLIDNNGDGEYDVIKAEEYRYLKVANIAYKERIIYGESYADNTDNTIDMSAPDSINIIERLSGSQKSQIEWEDIKSGDLICVASSEDKKFNHLVICEDQISGKLTETAWDTGYIGIDNTLYKLNPYFKKLCRNNGSDDDSYGTKIGWQYTFRLGFDKTVVLYENGGDQEKMMYGWLVKIANKKNTFSSVMIKVFTENGKMDIYSLAEKMILDGEKRSDDYVADQLKMLDENGKFFRFQADVNNVIKKIDLPMDANLSAGNCYSESLAPDNGMTLFYKEPGLLYRSALKSFGLRFNISDSVCFIVPPAESDYREHDEYYSIAKDTYFINNDPYDMKAYDLRSNGSARAVVCIDSKIPALTKIISYDIECGVIEKTAAALNEEGEECTALYIYQGKKFNVYYMDPNNDYSVEPDEIQPGDVVKFLNDDKNKIISLSLDFDFSTFAIKNEYIPDRTKLNQQSYLLGTIYNIAGNYANIAQGRVQNGSYSLDPSFRDNLYNVTLGATVFVCVKRDAQTGTVLKMEIKDEPVSSFISYVAAGQQADLILMRMRYLTPSMSVVYRIEYV